jgi:hypothetical protein
VITKNPSKSIQFNPPPLDDASDFEIVGARSQERSKEESNPTFQSIFSTVWDWRPARQGYSLSKQQSKESIGKD